MKSMLCENNYYHILEITNCILYILEKCGSTCSRWWFILFAIFESRAEFLSFEKFSDFVKSKAFWIQKLCDNYV